VDEQGRTHHENEQAAPPHAAHHLMADQLKGLRVATASLDSFPNESVVIFHRRQRYPVTWQERIAPHDDITECPRVDVAFAMMGDGVRALVQPILQRLGA
jgi:hypothetical protein